MEQGFPDYPSFRPLALADHRRLTAMLRSMRFAASEYTFTNLFCWREAYRAELAVYGKALLIRATFPGQSPFFFMPLGSWHDEDFVELLRDATERGLATSFQRGEKKFVAQLEGKKGQHLDVQEDRNQWDYVYARHALETLASRKLHAKKNLLHQFLRNVPSYEVICYSENLSEEATAFLHRWYRERGEADTRLAEEKQAMEQLLQHAPQFGVKGLAVRIAGKMAALTFGERLNDKTFVIHLEKASTEYRGLYQFINQSFVASLPSEIHCINREQDLGIPGLRRAKLSYHPSRMVEKYTISLVKNSTVLK